MVDTLTREDVRDLTRIPAVEHIATLMQLMPERVGSPLSLNALREDIETSYTVVRNAVRAMELTYAVFLLSPLSHKIARHHADQARALGNVPYVQLTWAGNIYKKSAPGFFRISVGRFFEFLENGNAPSLVSFCFPML